MEKSDAYLKKRTIMKIKASTMTPYDFQFTKFYEISDNEYPVEFVDGFILKETELPVCFTKINIDNWYLLTTRQVIGYLNEGKFQISLEDILSYDWGDYKRAKLMPYTFIKMELKDGKVYKLPLEVGKASMVTIYGFLTLLQLRV
jgi:hypothetical protein